MAEKVGISVEQRQEASQNHGQINRVWREVVGKSILENGTDPAAVKAKIAEAKQAIEKSQFPQEAISKPQPSKSKEEWYRRKNTEALGEWALDWNEQKGSSQDFIEELAEKRAATRMYNSLGELHPDAIKPVGGGSVDWFPTALGLVTDPELVNILNEYNSYFTDKKEAGLLPEGTTSISSLRQEITTALLGGAISTPGGKSEATKLIRYLDRLAIGDSVRLQKAEKTGVVELNAIATGIIDAPNWETALNTAGSDAEVLVTIGETFNIQSIIPATGAVYLPVANAFRLLEQNKSSFIGKSPAEKSALMRKVGWNIIGLPDNPMAHSPAEKYVDLAKMIWEMTWRTAKLGDRRLDYAWKTMNFAKSITTDTGVNDLFKTGAGKTVLENEVKVTDFWELVANSLDDPVADPSRTNARAVGLMTLVGGRPQMVASFEMVAVENIPFDKIKGPLLTKTAADGKKADTFRDATRNRGFLNTTDANVFLEAAITQGIYTHLEGKPRAQSIMSMFEVMVDHGLTLKEAVRNSKSIAPYDRMMDVLLTKIRDGCGLDFNDPYTFNEFSRLKKKYWKYLFGMPGSVNGYKPTKKLIGGTWVSI